MAFLTIITQYHEFWNNQEISMPLFYCFCFFLTMAVFADTSCSAAESPYFQMRGIVLDVHDLETVDWAKLAHENGINTIGTHITPSQVTKFILTEKGQKFLADCQRYGIQIEHQLHAMGELLPRELFADDPDMFRMNKEGKRVKDHNLCVHSEKALGIVTKNASHYARLLPAANHRYYFWLDDDAPVCECPECSRYSPSEQGLIVENRIIKELRQIDPDAQLAHLAYMTTLDTPRRIKPEPGIFLEFAPIERTWEQPFKDGETKGQSGITHEKLMRHLKENLTVFPVETAVVLEYWLDVSLFSQWKKPAVKLPWHKNVFDSDIETYADLGIKNVTTFAVYMDDVYFTKYPDTDFLDEYGNGLKYFVPKKNPPAKIEEYSVKTIDGKQLESEWASAEKIGFTNPWNRQVCPATSLSLLKDDQNLYFFFDVEDDELILNPTHSNKRDNESEDRVEMFFSKDKEMNEYYCLEIDPKGRVLSYRGHYYRNFQFEWEPPEGFHAVGNITSEGYTVKGSIPLQFFRDFIFDDGILSFGAYRAEFSKAKDGTLIMNWLTWIDPQTASPDFHVPSSLGRLKLK